VRETAAEASKMTTSDIRIMLNGALPGQIVDCELFRGNFVEKLTASLLVLDLCQMEPYVQQHQDARSTTGKTIVGGDVKAPQ